MTRRITCRWRERSLRAGSLLRWCQCHCSTGSPRSEVARCVLCSSASTMRCFMSAPWARRGKTALTRCMCLPLSILLPTASLTSGPTPAALCGSAALSFPTSTPPTWNHAGPSQPHPRNRKAPSPSSGAPRAGTWHESTCRGAAMAARRTAARRSLVHSLVTLGTPHLAGNGLPFENVRWINREPLPGGVRVLARSARATKRSPARTPSATQAAAAARASTATA